MGILKEGITEVIATTALNAAPMGIHSRDGELSIRLFLGTHTAKNLMRDGYIVGNFVSDPVIYVKTAFEDLDADAFEEEQVNNVTVWRLRDADAWVILSGVITQTTSQMIRFALTLEKEIVVRSSVPCINRGFNNLIDATVHATRYKMTRDHHLKDLIDYHSDVIHTCGGKREQEALELLLKQIERD